MAGIAVFGKGFGVPAISLLILITTVGSDKPTPTAVRAILREQSSHYDSAGVLLRGRSEVAQAKYGSAEDFLPCLELLHGQSWRYGIHQHWAG